MRIPSWRRKQIDDAEFARERRALDRMGMLCGFEPVRTACAYCDWTAEYSGGGTLEAVLFLRKVLIEHCERLHPEQCPPPADHDAV